MSTEKHQMAKAMEMGDMQEFILEDEMIETAISTSPTKVCQQTSLLESAILPRSNELLQKINDFSRSDSAIALVIGAKSSGKSYLLTAFESLCSNCQLVQGYSKLSFSDIFAVSCYGDESLERIDNTIDAFIQAIKEYTDEYLLIVDDADFLSLDSLLAIIKGFAQAPLKGIKLVLAGEASLQKRLDSLEELQPFSQDFTNLQVMPLTFVETKDYLRKILAKELNVVADFFSKTVCQDIFELSEGYLGRINRVASQFTNQTARSVFSTSKTKLKRTSRTRSGYVDVLLAIGILTLLVIILAKIYLTGFTTQSHPHTVVSQPQTQTLASVQVEQDFSEDEAVPSYIASIENQSIEDISYQQTSLLELPLPPSIQPLASRNKVFLQKRYQHVPAITKK